MGFKISCQVGGGVSKFSNVQQVQGFLDKTPRGVGFFFRFFSTRLAKIKTPPPGGFRKFHALDFVSAAEITHDQ